MNLCRTIRLFFFPFFGLTSTVSSFKKSAILMQDLKCLAALLAVLAFVLLMMRSSGLIGLANSCFFISANCFPVVAFGERKEFPLWGDWSRISRTRFAFFCYFFLSIRSSAVWTSSLLASSSPIVWTVLLWRSALWACFSADFFTFFINFWVFPTRLGFETVRVLCSKGVFFYWKPTSMGS